MSTFSLIGIIVLMFFTLISILLIVNGQSKEFPMRLIGLFFLTYSLYFLSRFLWFDLKIILVYPHLLGIFGPLLFIPSPLFYLIIRNLVQKRSSLDKLDLLHFLPGFLHFIDLLGFYSQSFEEKKVLAETVINNPSSIYLVVSGYLPALVVHLVRSMVFTVYLVLSLRLLFIESRKEILHLIEKNRWLAVTLIFMLLLKLFSFFQYLNNVQFFFSGEAFPEIKRSITGILIVLIVFYSFYNYFRFKWNVEPPETHKKKKHKISEYKSDIINEAKDLDPDYALKIKLNNLFEVDQIYLEKDLTAFLLAEKLGIRYRDLPGLLKTTYGCTYIELINRFRVSFAVQKIREEYLDKHTMESLAEISGFSSRITFFNVFKKEMGLSPSEFRKSIFDK